jgi:hypothetical protein
LWRWGVQENIVRKTAATAGDLSWNGDETTASAAEGWRRCRAWTRRRGWHTGKGCNTCNPLKVCYTLLVCEVKLFMCLIKHRAMNTEGGGWRYICNIPHLCSRWRRVVSFTYRPFHPLGNSPSALIGEEVRWAPEPIGLYSL